MLNNAIEVNEKILAELDDYTYAFDAATPMDRLSSAAQQSAANGVFGRNTWSAR